MHRHNYYFAQLKAEFEAVQFGASAEDTLYKRVEYVLLTCGCGESVKKTKVEYDQSGNPDTNS